MKERERSEFQFEGRFSAFSAFVMFWKKNLQTDFCQVRNYFIFSLKIFFSLSMILQLNVDGTST